MIEDTSRLQVIHKAWHCAKRLKLRDKFCSVGRG
jgi:hypothetical protein